MVFYLEAVDLGVWRLTRDWIKPQKNPKKSISRDEKEIHVSAYSKNFLFELISVGVFNQIFTLTKANEIWLKGESFMIVLASSVSKKLLNKHMMISLCFLMSL
jgi:hypothetical protein